jgi:hypothetical protein
MMLNGGHGFMLPRWMLRPVLLLLAILRIFDPPPVFCAGKLCYRSLWQSCERWAEPGPFEELYPVGVGSDTLMLDRRPPARLAIPPLLQFLLWPFCSSKPVLNTFISLGVAALLALRSDYLDSFSGSGEGCRPHRVLTSLGERAAMSTRSDLS